jgi:murein DD-endopeptidase MepM/ murein hydrolase activator NlpD
MKISKFFLHLVALLTGFLCCFAPPQFLAADDSPLAQGSTLQTPPSLVYPLARRWRISSLFDHTNPGDNGSQDGYTTICTGASVSDDPSDPNDQILKDGGSVRGYTDYDTNLKDLRWKNFVPGWLWYDRHYGYDLACPFDTPVGAATSGTAVREGEYAVKVTHSSGYRTYYRHLNQRIVQTVSVQPGQWIGTSGDEGGTLDPHLHFEMRNSNNKYVDPCGWQGGYTDPWSYNVGNVWASGDPIPMGYRNQNGAAQGPFVLAHSSIRQEWFYRDGEPGSPLGNVFSTTAIQGTGEILALQVQRFEHGEIKYIEGTGVVYYVEYDETYLPDIRAAEDDNTPDWNSTIIVRNNGASSAIVNITLYTDDGRVLDSRTHTSVPAHGVWTLDVQSALDDFLNQAEYHGMFEGSAIVYASQDVAVVVKSLDSDEVIGYTGFSPASSLGFARPGTTVYLPQYFNNHSGWYSTAWVQNTGSAATTVTAYYYNLGGGQVGSQSHNIAPGAAYGFTPPAGIPSTGSMRLTAGQPLAAVLEARKASPAQSGVVNGLSGGRNSLRAPLIMRSYGGWTTGLVVQNIGSSPADIDVAYYDGGGNPVGAGDHATGVPRWASQSFYPPAVGDGFLGSAVVTSAQPLVALVNELDSSGQRLLNHCAFDRGVPTLYLPLVENNNGGWTSGIIVQNTVGSAHTVSVTYYNSNGGLVGTQSLSNIPPYAQRFFVPAVPSGSAYSAVLSSSKRFAVVVNEVKEGVGGMSYNGSD